MATYTPYREIRRKLEHLQGFEGNSVSGMLAGTHYKVKSYEKIMLDLNTETGEIFFNNYYYSNTTSKIQNLIKAAFNLNDQCKERKLYLIKKKNEMKKIVSCRCPWDTSRVT